MGSDRVTEAGDAEGHATISVRVAPTVPSITGVRFSSLNG